VSKHPVAIGSAVKQPATTTTTTATTTTAGAGAEMGIVKTTNNESDGK